MEYLPIKRFLRKKNVRAGVRRQHDGARSHGRKRRGTILRRSDDTGRKNSATDDTVRKASRSQTQRPGARRNRRSSVLVYDMDTEVGNDPMGSKINRRSQVEAELEIPLGGKWGIGKKCQ